MYELIVSSETEVHAGYEQGTDNNNLSLTLAKVMLLRERITSDPYCINLEGESLARTPLSSLNPVESTSEGSGGNTEDFDGCTLLHLACETADIGMIEHMGRCLAWKWRMGNRYWWARLDICCEKFGSSCSDTSEPYPFQPFRVESHEKGSKPLLTIPLNLPSVIMTDILKIKIFGLLGVIYSLAQYIISRQQYLSGLKYI